MKKTNRTCLALFILLFGLGSLSNAAEIHQAAQAGDLAKVKELLAADPAAVNAKDENGRTPLHFAAQGKHGDVLRYLVEKGAGLNALDNNGVAPLHILVRSGQTEAARFLIDKGADIDIKDPVKLTPLNMAAESGLEAMVKLLIEKGADIENKHAYGRTPLVGAARERGNINVIRMLLDAGADVNSSDNWNATALDLAAWRGFEEVVNLLLERGAVLPKDALRMRELLQNAAEKGMAGLFSRVVEKGVDLKFFIEDGGTLLHAAAAGGSVPILEILLSQGLDINLQDANGWSPLHFAAEMGRGEAVSLLLDKNADINSRTLMGQTAYNIAEENRNENVVRILAEKGADLNPARFPELKGPYLGQKTPGRIPEVFAKGIVSGRYGLHSNIAFSPDGREAFWSIMIPPRGRGYGTGKTLVSRQVEGRWTYPVEAVFEGIPLDDVVFFHPDGTKLYDMAVRPRSPGGKPEKENIWEWRKIDGGWGQPRPLDEAINNNSLHWQFGVDRKSNIYLTLNIPGSYGESDIYVSRLAGGRYQTPENLGPGVNTAGRDEFPFVQPDGAYLLFVRDFDIWVSFPDAGGKWGEAKKLGPEINTRGMELLPMVSPDGRFLFFSRGQDIYWVDAGILEDLKPKKAAQPQADDGIPIEVVRLSDRVLVLKEDVMGNNITAIASKKGLVVVDTSGYASTARKVRGIIEKEFGRNDFAYVVNTHWHWDHAWGNQAFPEATIVGHEACPAMMERDKEYVVTRVQNMKQRLEEQKNKLAQADPDSRDAAAIRGIIRQTERDIKDHSEGFEITPPQITFNDRLTLNLGDLTLKMVFFGRAHSGADIFIHIPEEGILLTGDIFLDRNWLPLFAGQPELDIPRWIEVLHTILDGQDKLTKIIPGHLDFWTPEKLDLWRDYIVDLWTGLKKAKEEGLGFEAAAARLPLGEKYDYLRENGHSAARIQGFHQANLEAFWSQLVESAARLVQYAIQEGGAEAGRKKFAELKAQKERYYFNERQFNAVGYQFLSSGKIDDAISVFKMNVELYPKAWNVYDSLAEAYAAAGETELAVQNYERSLELNPDNQNGKDQLKNLKKETDSLLQPSGQSDSLQVAERIKNVESGLLEFKPGAPPGEKKWTLAERMAAHKIPGVSIAVIDDYKVDWTKGYGLLRGGRDAAVTPASIFQAASTTKVVTAVLILHFVETGILDLDRDVNAYLKSWRVPDNEYTQQKKVTLRLLLTHQSGLPATNFPRDEKAGAPTLAQVLKGEYPAQNKPAVVEYLPGSKWQYSNIGYVALQQVLEDVSGKSYMQLAREIVFEPLGMDSSTVAYPLNAEMHAREAIPHDEEGQAQEPSLPPSALAQGGLLTTPSDLARLTIALMNAYQGRASRPLSQISVRQMFHKEADLDPKIFGFPVGQGLGVMLMGKGEDFSFAHPGSNYPGTTCWLVGYPGLGKGAVIMANGVNGDLLSLEILPAISNEYGWPANE